jgi:KDO2-lipid IV(A) lauroyltransferase
MLPSIVRWLSRRSLGSLHSWGFVVGWLTYALSPTYRRRFRANARTAGLSPAHWRPAVAEAGRMLMELPFLWLRPPDEPLAPHVTWRGDDIMERALEDAAVARRGLLIMTPHLGAFEVIAQAYAERFGARRPATVLYRRARKPWLRELVDRSRTRAHLSTAPASLAGVRQMLRALKRGETVGLLPDQVPPRGMGVWAPFFGRPAYTMTLAARLAQQARADILLIYCERLPHGAGYVVHVFRMNETLPEGDAADEGHQIACATIINRQMERLIMRSPTQYLWGYHRYKSPASPRKEDGIDTA